MNNVHQAVTGDTARPALQFGPAAPAVSVTTWWNRFSRSGIPRQILLQIFLLLVLASVLFPVLWIVSMAVDPRGISRPTDLTLFPANATLEAFYDVLSKPLSNVVPIYFCEMLMNSLFVALGTALFTVTLGASAAYAFSRFKFIGRQAGLLTFIVLLILPATGTLPALYTMFGSVQINTVLAMATTSYFSAFLIAALVFIIFNMVASYLRHDPDRAFNPSPRLVAALVVVFASSAVVGAVMVMFQRSPVYASAVDAPILEVKAPRDSARDQVRRATASLENNLGRAQSTELRAQVAVQNAQALAAISEAAGSASDLDALLAAEIEKRAGLRDGSVVLDALTAARAALEGGDRAAALQALADGVAAADAEAADLTATAQSRREGAQRAEAALQTAEAELAAAQAAYDEVQGRAGSLRTHVLLGMIPVYLLAWAGILVGAGVVWYAVRALRGSVEPATAVRVLMWALLAALILGIGTSSLQARITPNMSQTMTLRLTLLGLALALSSGGLPFTIWNLKGYFDTIPKDLEQAAWMDGAGRVQTFFLIMLPLALPAFAITILFSFMGSWTEFILSWLFLIGNTSDYTLAMGLVNMAGGSNTPPPNMQQFAAMAILVSLPIIVLFFAAQRWIVSGLTIGAVK